MGWPTADGDGSANARRPTAPLRLFLACRPGNSPSLLLGLPSSPLWHSLRQDGVSLPEPRPIRHAPSDRTAPASALRPTRTTHRSSASLRCVLATVPTPPAARIRLIPDRVPRR